MITSPINPNNHDSDDIHWVRVTDIEEENWEAPMFRTKKQCQGSQDDDELVCIAVACPNGA